MLKALGFFHFRENVEDPAGSLRLELERTGTENDISGSLIVLPEAFNLGEPYYSGAPGPAKIPLGQALDQLRGIARQWSVTFVAGLLGQQYNSAYWLDHKATSELMCHKMVNDRTGHYVPHSGERRCDERNPFKAEDACVGVLICADALEETSAVRERRERLLRYIKRCSRPYRILCVPGQMGSHCDPHFARASHMEIADRDCSDDSPSFVIPPRTASNPSICAESGFCLPSSHCDICRLGNVDLFGQF